MLDELLAGNISKFESSLEEELFCHWGREKLYQLKPVDMAVKLGAESSSLDGVFIAGYQASLKFLFADTNYRGWSGFLYAENSKEFPDFSPTSIVEREKGYILSGFKSWVAQSRFVERLIVTVKPERGISYDLGGVVIEKNANGITVFHRESVEFLRNLSQGWAIFDNVLVTHDQMFERDLIEIFRKSESHFMILSILSFLISNLISSEKKIPAVLIELCQNYVQILERGSSEGLEGLGELRPLVKKSIDIFCRENRSLELAWGVDKKFLYMYV